MKRIVLLVLIAMFAFSSSAYAAHTAESQETRSGVPGYSKHVYEVSVSGQPNTDVTVTLVAKGPLGQREPVSGTSITVTLDSTGRAMIYSPDLSCCYTAFNNPTSYVIQAQFEGNYGTVDSFYLYGKK